MTCFQTKPTTASQSNDLRSVLWSTVSLMIYGLMIYSVLWSMVSLMIYSVLWSTVSLMIYGQSYDLRSDLWSTVRLMIYGQTYDLRSDLWSKVRLMIYGQTYDLRSDFWSTVFVLWSLMLTPASILQSSSSESLSVLFLWMILCLLLRLVKSYKYWASCRTESSKAMRIRSTM